MIKLIRKKIAQRTISIAVLFAIVFQIFIPNLSYALTGGPSQPEVEGFTPVGTTEMVNLFTGDFNYNIPLLSVDGYPINIAYSAAPTMDEEASWVGLGWSLNPGVINRNMRGIPDDFNGEKIEKKVYIEPNWTVGVTGTTKLKLFGFSHGKKKLSATASLGLFYNNYKGFGIDASLGNYNISDTLKPPMDSVKLHKILKEKAVSSVVNMASDFFPESRMIMKGLGKYAGGKKLGSFLNAHKSISQNSSSRSYEFDSYTPQMNLEFNNHNYRIGVSYGGDLWGLFLAPSLSGSFSMQTLAKTNYDKETYGYIYHWNKNSNDVILDFNREKDAEYTKNKPVLPIPISTYDLYNINGQGVSGMIKPFRNGIDVYYDDQRISKSYSGGGNVELGVGTDLHTEIHLTGQISESKSEKWITDLTDHLESEKPENHPNNVLYERTYFKTIGERLPLNTQIIQNANLNSVLSPRVQTGFTSIGSPNNFYSKASQSVVNIDNKYNINSNLFSTKREKRNQLVSFLTYENKEAFIEPSIKSVKENNVVKNVIPALDGKRNSNHIGEFIVLKSDGTRYIYGIAAYNNYQREVSFTTAAKGNANPEKGIVEYNEGKDILDEGNDKKGFEYRKSDRFYSSTKTKGYAHSYLITSILSQDYTDVYPKGVGPEDLGNYTKFDYELMHNDYKWRMPYKPTTANFMEGLRSEAYDNRASFVEGTKEIWQLSTIQGKNQIAVFQKGVRTDALDANKEPNDRKVSYCLQTIVLYDRSEFEKYADPIKYATPIKKIHFVYDNSLCKNIENTSSASSEAKGNGKLTLLEIYTTFGNSTKKFTSYKFDYSNSINPNYDAASINRWGGFKPARTVTSVPHNLELPYVEQNQSSENSYSSAWSLNTITLPSGGIIKINYEADDYAYVQNRRAMQMTQIIGIGDNTTFSGSNLIYDGDNANNYLYFNLPTNLNGLTASQYIEETMSGVKNICFRVMLQLSDTKFEWVNGYADIADDDPYGMCPGSSTHFYIKLKQKNLESLVNSSKKISPLTKAGFNFIKTNLPHTINPELADLFTDDNDVRAEEVFYKLLSLDDIIDKLQGIDQKLLTRGNCNRIKEYGGNLWGWVRLNNAFKAKLGGGYRVKKITLDDNWTTISDQTSLGNLNQETGQEFDYTIVEDFGTGKRKISSGVAAFEPSAGSEENPFKQPIGFERKVRTLPNEEDYIDGPVGESFYPSAVVGYSKVTVSNIKPLNSSNQPLNLKSHGVGKTINEFYTAKDFPVIVDYTGVDVANINPPMIDLLLFSATIKKVGVSQGFDIILNDMHGKPKGIYVYSESLLATEPEGKLISGTTYFYQTDPNDPARLNNEVDVVESVDGYNQTVSKKIIGVETEVYGDNRTKADDFYSGAVELNWSTLITLWGLTFPTIVPTYEQKTERFYSSTLLTVKNYYGINYKTEVFQDGAHINSENIAYDGATGEVLVTKTTNEYKEDQYNTTYPAHWKYDGMGQAYKNIGVSFSLYINEGSKSVFTAPIVELIQDNDEVLCEFQGRKFNGVIKRKLSNFEIYVQDPETYTFLPFVTPNSVQTDPSYLKITVTRSGRRNMQSMPIFNASTLLNPIKNGGLLVDNSTAIIDAKVVTYNNEKYNYKSFNDQFNVTPSTSEVLNALNYLFANQQIDLKNGIQEIQNAPLGKGIYRYPISINSNILNSNNDFTNSFFHKLNVINGKPNYNIYVSYNFGNSNISNLPDRRNVRFEIPIFEINNNTASKISIDINFNHPGNTVGNNFYNNYKILSILPSLNTNDNTPEALVGCNYSYGSNYGTIVFQKTSSPFDQVTMDNSTNGALEVNITRCAQDPYAKLTLEDHFYKQNHYLAINPSTNWNPSSTYLYKGERNYNTNNIKADFPSLNSRTGIKGIYNSFEEFDFYSNYENVQSKWKQSELTTLIDPYTGMELESRDAIGRYRSLLLSSDKTLLSNFKKHPTEIYYINSADKLSYSTKPTMYAENAQHSEINVFNFESNDEIQYVNSNYPQRKRTDKHYFSIAGNNNVTVTSAAHTGNGAMYLQGQTSAEFFVTDNYNDQVFKNAILPYYPKTGKQLISGWIKIEKPFYQTTSNQAYCKVEVINNGNNAIINTVNIYPTGPIIEGWQRFQGEFVIPAPNPTAGQVPDKLRVTLFSGDINQIAYFDDIRMQPFDANSKTYIYDEQQRLSAELDENNYATFYYYDHKGELTLIKRETDKGIVTVTETRKQSVKNN